MRKVGPHQPLPPQALPQGEALPQQTLPVPPEALGGRNSRAGGAGEGAGRQARFSAVSKGGIDLLSASGGGRPAELSAQRGGLRDLGGGVPKLGLATCAHPFTLSLCIAGGAFWGLTLISPAASGCRCAQGQSPRPLGRLCPVLIGNWGGFCIPGPSCGCSASLGCPSSPYELKLASPERMALLSQSLGLIRQGSWRWD